MINRSHVRTLSQNSALHKEEACSTDSTYYCDTSRVGVEARIEDLERRINKIAKHRRYSSICHTINIETESAFSTWITRFAILRKFKQPHLDSYNGLGSPVDHIRTYRAQMALATNADELLCLAFPSTLKGPVA